jgi:ethanolamine ammonia-lyase small subunit
MWEHLRELTQARVGLERIGHSIATRDVLDFQVSHALARDSVKAVWDVAAFESKLKKAKEKPILVKTKVSIREQYLKFPSLGRRLCDKNREKLLKWGKRHPVDIVFIVSDGLSVRAVDTHFIPFWKVFKPLMLEAFRDEKTALVVAPFGRVALSDDIGETLGAKASVILIGERPGLSSVDSLGIYLTYHPQKKHTDADRNCISNIHPPEGLSYLQAAKKLLFLLNESFRLGFSGVHLKEETLLADHLSSRLGLGL